MLAAAALNADDTSIFQRLQTDVFERAVGAGSRAARGALYVQADICRADLVVEIEAHDIFPSFAST